MGTGFQVGRLPVCSLGCTSAVYLDGGAILIGGPHGESHREHRHPEAQVTIHIPACPAATPTKPARRGWIVPADFPHAGAWPDETFSVVFHLTPGLLAMTADECGRRGQYELVGGETADPLILHLGSAAAEEMVSGRKGRLFLDSLQHVLAGRLIRGHCRAAGNRTLPGERLTDGQMRNLREFIEGRLDRAASITELAAAVRMGPQRLGRLLKASTGFSPHAFVNHLRIERAKQLLRDSALTLAEIAFTLGFASQSHFTAAFRRSVNLTPRAYRTRS